MTRRWLLALAPLLLTPALPAHAAPAAPAVSETFTDATGDGSAALDIRSVSVKNTARRVVVRVELPGAASQPLGAVIVYLDDDPERKGAEYGHFADFGSEYRYAPVKGWREQPTDDCVGDGRLRIDPSLRTITVTAKKRPGCLDGDAVRVAVTTIDDSGSSRRVDWLGGVKQWTPWVG